MAQNISKLVAMMGGNGGADSDTDKPESKQHTYLKSLKVGESVHLRLLPPTEGMEMNPNVVYVHKNGHPWQLEGKSWATTFCIAKNEGNEHEDECPLCQYAQALWDQYREMPEETEDEKKEKEKQREMASSYTAKREYMAEVVIRGREEEGIFLWRPNKTIMDAIISKMQHIDYGDITDLEEGTDIELKKVKDDTKDIYRKHGRYEIHFARKSSRLKDSFVGMGANRTKRELDDSLVERILAERYNSPYEHRFISNRKKMAEDLTEFLTKSGVLDDANASSELGYNVDLKETPEAESASETPSMTKNEFMEQTKKWDDDDIPF